MILVTHDVDEAIYLSGRIIIMTPHPEKSGVTSQFLMPEAAMEVVGLKGHHADQFLPTLFETLNNAEDIPLPYSILLSRPILLSVSGRMFSENLRK